MSTTELFGGVTPILATIASLYGFAWVIIEYVVF